MPPVRTSEKCHPCPAVLRPRACAWAETPRTRLSLIGRQAAAVHTPRRKLGSRDVARRLHETRELFVRHLRAIHPERTHFHVVQRLFIARAVVRTHRECP